MLTGRLHAREEILHHPSFLAIEREIASHLIGIHRRAPRLARLAASHRKWLLTQTLFAMHAGRDPRDPLSGLTASRLMQVASDLKVVSRNTAASFLAELVAYKFLRDVPDETPDRRLRLLETTEISDEAMHSWFLGHMSCLDRLYGGNRAALVISVPRLFQISHVLRLLFAWNPYGETRVRASVTFSGPTSAASFFTISSGVCPTTRESTIALCSRV